MGNRWLYRILFLKISVNYNQEKTPVKKLISKFFYTKEEYVAYRERLNIIAPERYKHLLSNDEEKIKISMTYQERCNPSEIKEFTKDF